MVLFKIIVTVPAVFTDVPAGLFVNAFHRWIQEQSVAGHLPIDVADYAHVAGGPGTILVCSEANIHVDSAGLTYVRKRPFAETTTTEGSIVESVRTATELAAKLASDPAVTGHFRVSPGGMRIRFNDRLLTPNTAEAANELAPVVVSAMAAIYPGRAIEILPVKLGGAELLEFDVNVRP